MISEWFNVSRRVNLYLVINIFPFVGKPFGLLAFSFLFVPLDLSAGTFEGAGGLASTANKKVERALRSPLSVAKVKNPSPSMRLFDVCIIGDKFVSYRNGRTMSVYRNVKDKSFCHFVRGVDHPNQGLYADKANELVRHCAYEMSSKKFPVKQKITVFSLKEISNSLYYHSSDDEHIQTYREMDYVIPRCLEGF